MDEEKEKRNIFETVKQSANQNLLLMVSNSVEHQFIKQKQMQLLFSWVVIMCFQVDVCVSAVIVINTQEFFEN